MARDPVCGMEVDEQQAVSQGLCSDHQDQRFCFCSSGCKEQFERSPQRYVGEQARQR